MEGLQLFSPLPTPSRSPTLASQRPLLGPCTQTHHHATLLAHHTQPASSQTSLHDTRTPTSLFCINPSLPCCTKVHQYDHHIHQHIHHADTAPCHRCQHAAFLPLHSKRASPSNAACYATVVPVLTRAKRDLRCLCKILKLKPDARNTNKLCKLPMHAMFPFLYPTLHHHPSGGLPRLPNIRDP